MSDLEAHRWYMISQKCFTAPWKLAHQPLCDWWTSRILLFASLEPLVVEILRQIPMWAQDDDAL